MDSKIFNNFVLQPFPDTYLIGIHTEIFSGSLSFVHSTSAKKLSRSITALRPLCFLKSSCSCPMDAKGVQVGRKICAATL